MKKWYFCQFLRFGFFGRDRCVMWQNCPTLNFSDTFLYAIWLRKIWQTPKIGSPVSCVVPEDGLPHTRYPRKPGSLCVGYYMLQNMLTVRCLWNVLVFQIHANCRIRRVYFSDRLYSEEELPAEFKLYLPVQGRKWMLSPNSCKSVARNSCMQKQLFTYSHAEHDTFYTKPGNIDRCKCASEKYKSASISHRPWMDTVMRKQRYI